MTMSHAAGRFTSDEAASKTRLRLWLRMLKASRMIEAELRERFRTQFNTTLPRFDVMAALDRNPDGLRMSRLSGVLRVSNGNVTGIVDRLAAEGLVERRAVADDRRAMEVRLTAAGRTHFSALAAAHETWVDELIAALPVGEAGRMMAGLSAIADSLEEEDAR